MVLAVSNYSDDPRSASGVKKMKGTMQTKSLKSALTGVIKTDPPAEYLHTAETASTAISSHDSNAGFNRYEISASVQSTPQVRDGFSTSSYESHTVDPSYYTQEVRQEYSQSYSSRSAPAYSPREQSETESVGSPVSDRIAVYKKNAKAVSVPKVSSYSVAANSDRYVQPARPPASKKCFGAVSTPQIPPASTPKSDAVSTPPSQNSAPAASNTSSILDPSHLEGGAQSDGSSQQAIVQSDDYWNNLKQSQREASELAKKLKQSQREASASAKKQSAKKSVMPSILANARIATCGVYDDDVSTATNNTNNTNFTSESSRNLLDSVFVGQKDDLGLVSKQELLCDFERNGMDKIKEIHQRLKNLTMYQPMDLMGRDIVATNMTTQNRKARKAKSSSKKRGGEEGLLAVRFSDKVEEHEAKEVKAPDVPSFMDDQGEEDESSIASNTEQAPPSVVDSDKVELERNEREMTEAPTKQKGFFKKLLRRTKRKNKKRVSSGPFQPTLEPMEEAEEDDQTLSGETVAGVPEAPKGGSKAAPEKKPEMAPAPSASEGFELIAGCTKAGKRAIMIAKAKNERSCPQEIKQAVAKQDPPPSTTNDKNDATPVVATSAQETMEIVENEGEMAVNEDRSIDSHDESINSIQGDSVFQPDNLVATKLLNMFESMFITGAQEEGALDLKPHNREV